MRDRPFGIPNAPEAELRRSPAAARVGRLAHESGLLLSHFEYRRYLRPIDGWVPDDRPDLFEVPAWQAGRLVEPKYGPFRHENPVGSFHPGHRAKWTAHELCHALVGFGWRADATPLFRALAAQMSELLPVVLYYFLDEAGLGRCAEHEGGGPLFGRFCPDCERAALNGPGAIDRRWFERGRAFVEAELAAVARARRLGRPVSHRYATLDLRSDAVAYVAAHRRRLESPGFARFVELFLGPEQGAHAHLDDLEARVWAVFEDLVGGPRASAWRGGRVRWMAQDVGARLLEVALVCDGEPAKAIDALVEALAAAVSGRETASEAALSQVIAGYEALYEDWILPEPEGVFAVGYPLPGGYGFAVDQAVEGLTQVMPATAALLDEALEPVVDAFVRQAPPARGPIARRFARFLDAEAPGPVADVARYEAAVAHPEPADAALDAFGTLAPASGGDWRLARGTELLPVGVDVRAMAAEPDAVPEDLDAVPSRPHTLAIRRVSAGDVVVAELSSEAAATCRRLAEAPVSLSELSITADEWLALQSLGLIRPVAWRVDAPGS